LIVVGTSQRATPRGLGSIVISTKRAEEWTGHLETLLESYKYQRELTARLDALESGPIDQTVINEIVLWKVNRYAKLSLSALKALNSVTHIKPGSHRSAKACLATLLRQPGVDLAMASAFLRFRNRNAFQIIDRRAYRAVFGNTYPLRSTSGTDAKLDLYFSYLDRLFELADAKHIDFGILDRALYVFDKTFNGKL
jgi:hypothetical protein